MYKAYTILTPNADLPITLEDAKSDLRMDELSHEDAVITAKVMACTSDIEKEYGLAILTQTVKEYWSAFPCSNSDPILLRINPVQQIDSIHYIDQNGLTQTWDTDQWTSGSYDKTTFIIPLPGYSWPSTWALPNAVIVTYVAGFGDSPSSVPTDISQAIKYKLADMFEVRTDSPQTFTRASENLLRKYYRWAV